MGFDRLKRIVRWARVTAAGSDTKAFATQQVEYQGKVGDCAMIFPYGFHANLTPDALVAMFAMGGNPENRAGIGWTPKTRPILKEGEVAFYHPSTNTVIKLNDGGGIDVNSDGAVNVTAPSVNVTAPTVNITATSVTVDAANTTFTGNVQIDGALNVDGNITSLLNVIATALLQGATLTVTGAGSIGGKDFTTHIHLAGTPPGNTGPVS